MQKLLKICLLLTLILSAQACEISRFVYYNFANITDYKIFPHRKINTGKDTFYFPVAQHARAPKTFESEALDLHMSFERFLEKDKTVAFVIIKNDSLYYEHYFNGYDQASTVASFSMAKTVMSMLIGIAIDEGYIHSVHDKISAYIPDLKHKNLREVTILQLLQMTSVLRFSENYTSPLSQVAGFYYGRHLRKRTKRLKVNVNRQNEFHYRSGNSQLLGLVLDHALPDGVTVSNYLEEKIWQPLQMQFPATWSIDQEENGIEKTFCCLNAKAIDYAKLGMLYLHKGRFNGQQIVPESWVKTSTKIDTTAGSAWYYQYQWWLPTKDGDFMAEGILGQYIYVNPKKHLVIVRLGKKEPHDWSKILPYISSLY